MKARVQVELVTVICPVCDEIIPDEKSGSTFINLNDYDNSHSFLCVVCGKSFQLPKKLYLQQRG